MTQAEWGAPPAYRAGQSQHYADPALPADAYADPYSDAYSDPYPEPAQEDPFTSPAPGAAASSGTLFNVIGAVLSIGLMAGLGYWGYRLAVRDVSGVPVVRAMAGPMRVQPDDPGGQEAAYQGFAVNDVQARGGAAEPANRLALAPRDTGLAPEDLAPVEGGAGRATAVSAAPVSDAQMPLTGEDADTGDVQAAMLALADQLSQGVEPLTEITPTSAGGAAQAVAAPRTTEEIVDQVVSQVVAAPEILPASVPGLARSPFPALRPAGLVTQASAQITGAAAGLPAPAPVQDGVREVAASSIPLGTQLVQLGAFASPEIARAEWDRLATRFDAYFEGKDRVVMEAMSGGRKFWRLRAVGFDNLADARRFCAVLAAGRAACIPVVTR